MKKELDRLRNFSTEFSPNENRSNFFLGKILSAAGSSKDLQKKTISNQTSIADAQEEFYNNNSGVEEEVSKDHNDSRKRLKEIAAKSSDPYTFSEKSPESLKTLYDMIRKIRSAFSK